MGVWTLAFYDTGAAAWVENAFSDWGIAQEGAQVQLVNMGMDVLTLTVPTALVTDDPIWDFEAEVKVYRGREWDGVNMVWTGGVCVFQGKRLQHVLEGRPDFEGVLYQFGNAWYDIENCAYQQTVYTYTGDPENLASTLMSEVVLFQKVTGAGTWISRNVGEQISDILQHVLTQAAAAGFNAPFQIGTMEPDTAMYTYETRDITCSQAIAHVLRSCPNAAMHWDYTTSPPTVHVTKREGTAITTLGLTLTLAIADGVQHESLRLVPRQDLQLRGVVLIFKQANNSNGQVWIQPTVQKYPLAGPDGGRRVLVKTIDLQGYTRTDVVQPVTVEAVANTRAWWQSRLPELRSLKIRDFSLNAGTLSVVEDGTGDAVSLVTYPNFLSDGELADWMKVGGNSVLWKDVTISCEAAYKQYDVVGSGEADTSGVVERIYTKKLLTIRGKVTNATSGTYQIMTSGVEGESIPTGLAQKIYDDLATLQYDGELTFVQEEATIAARPGMVLNLTGGRAEWATMGALVQQVTIDYSTGRTRIVVGPAKHLSAGDLTQLFLMNRHRRVWFNPVQQATAQGSAATSIELGKKPRENSAAGLEALSQFMAASGQSGNRTMAQLDTVNQRIALQVVDDAGAPVTGQAAVRMNLADLGGRTATFFELQFKDATTCALYKTYVLGTTPEAVT